jgi:TonB family protein
VAALSPIRRTLLALLLAPALAAAQTSAPPATDTPAPIERHDPALEAATDLIGRPLFLRCLCSENNVAFDSDGLTSQPVKPTDWTLAGFALQKVERKDPTTLELDGVRVAIRYAPDRHEFDRHPLNDEKIKILVRDDGKSSFRHTLNNVFADGLDLRLQHALPSFWQHYFLPQTPWPKDSLDGQTVVTPGAPEAPPGIVEPQPLKRSNASFTPEASHDHVTGDVVLRLVVDTAGDPRRIAIVQPLGYGLDARAVDAAGKDHFAPATTPEGKPVAANIQVRQGFTVVAAPH